MLIGFMIIGGCATTGLITEPTNVDSALLLGRIKLTCTEFPASWHMNGDHTNGIVVALRNLSTNKTVTVRSRGADGLFSVIDPDAGDYIIEGFTIKVSSKTASKMYRITLGHETNDNIYFKIQRNAVNNLGDIRWLANYETKGLSDTTGKVTTTTYLVNTSHNYECNYSELNVWFGKTYPDSAWTGKNWIGVEYISR